MIEFLLIFGFGFLVAILLAMLVAPAVYGRIVKLTEDRMKATVPLNLAEVKGKADLARAAYASENAKLSTALDRELDVSTKARLRADKLQADLAVLSGKKQEADQRIQTLANETDHLKLENLKKQEAIEKLGHDIRELDRIRQAGEREMSQMYNDLMAASTEIENLRIDLATSATEAVNLNAEVGAERNRRQKVEKDVEELAEKLKDAENRFEREQDDHNEARINLSAALSSLYNREEEIRQAETGSAKLKEDLEEARRQHEKNLQQLLEYETEVGRWTERYEGAQSSLQATKANLQELRETVSRLQSEQEAMQRELEAGEKKIVSLEQALAAEQTRSGKLARRVTQMADDLEAHARGKPVEARDLPPEETSAASQDKEAAQVANGTHNSAFGVIGRAQSFLTKAIRPGPLDSPMVANSNAKSEAAEYAALQQQQMALVEKLKAAGTDTNDDALREELADIAARIIALSGRREGEDSAILKLLAEDPSSDPGDAGSHRISLADRARAELEERAF